MLEGLLFVSAFVASVVGVKEINKPVCLCTDDEVQLNVADYSKEPFEIDGGVLIVNSGKLENEADYYFASEE